MNILIIVLVLALYAYLLTPISSQITISGELSCNNNDNVTQQYQNALYAFVAESYKKVTLSSDTLNHVVISPVSLWILLTALAEGADPTTRQGLFRFLNLPDDPCIRLKYYQLATSRYVTNDEDVHISNTRALVIDESLTMKPVYHNFLFRNSLLDVVSAPIHGDPQTTLKEIRRVTSAALENLDLSGNSVILDAVDYSGLWQTAFDDAIVERSPFFNAHGEKIGSVDMMKTKLRARVTYFENFKSVELPVGSKDRYLIRISTADEQKAVSLLKRLTGVTIYDFINSFKRTYVPVEIAIPRFNISSEFDIKQMLEYYGIKNLWRDPIATGNISEPAALPSGFVQRTTMSVGTAGLQPAPTVPQLTGDEPTGADPRFGGDFIANKPFVFGLFDTETESVIVTGSFTKPTYID